MSETDEYNPDRPAGSESDETIRLQDLINLEDLQRIQDSFARALGVASIITDLDGNALTRPSNFTRLCELIGTSEEGARRCRESNRIRGQTAREHMKPIYHQCKSCGFVDASAPIVVAGQHIANWLIGQSNVLGVNGEQISAYAREIGTDPEEMLAALEEVPRMSLAEFNARLTFLWDMAKELSDLGYVNLKMSEDIARRQEAEAELRLAHAELEVRVGQRTAELAEANLALRTEREALHAKNVALKEIMGQVEEEKQHMARYVHTNVSRILLPLLTSLERRIYPEGEQYIRLIKNCLDDITGPYLSQLESQFFQLTPRELEICNMIRNGLSSKEIAETLNTSEQTVLKQRTMVRRKLGLAGSKTNLVAFLNRIG